MDGAVIGDGSSPPPTQHDVQGHVYAKMRARLREVEEFDVRGKRQRTVTSLAATGGSAHVGDHANMLPRLREMREANSRLAAAREVVDLTGTSVSGTVQPAGGMGGAAAGKVILYTSMTQNDDLHLLNGINARTQFTKSNASPQPLKNMDNSRPVRRSSAA